MLKQCEIYDPDLDGGARIPVVLAPVHGVEGAAKITQGAADDKADVLKGFLTSNGYQKQEVAYIGDDINDLGAMSLCWIVGCPGDSVPEVKAAADYICQKDGGRGAVREFIDWLICNERG